MLLITCFIFGLLGSLTWAGPHGRTICPSGTFAYKDGSEWHCYKFFEERLNFQEAEEECQYKWKGHLASFTSEKQGRSIAAYVAKENIEGESIWIGLRRDEGSSVSTGWRWVDGSRSKYRKWNPREPNNMGNNELCVVLHPYYAYLSWNDIYCGRQFPFLCKWKPS